MTATGMTPDGKKRQVDLQHVARMAGWATPQAQDCKQNGPRKKSKAVMLIQQVLGIDQKVNLRGAIQQPLIAQTESKGASLLNPLFSLWLMGYPAEWASCGERAMQSFRK
jgi:hypothetical protein